MSKPRSRALRHHQHPSEVCILSTFRYNLGYFSCFRHLKPWANRQASAAASWLTAFLNALALSVRLVLHLRADVPAFSLVCRAVVLPFWLEFPWLQSQSNRD